MSKLGVPSQVYSDLKVYYSLRWKAHVITSLFRISNPLNRIRVPLLKCENKTIPYTGSDITVMLNQSEYQAA